MGMAPGASNSPSGDEMEPVQALKCPKCGAPMRLLAESSGAGKHAKGWRVFRCDPCDLEKWVE